MLSRDPHTPSQSPPFLNVTAAVSGGAPVVSHGFALLRQEAVPSLGGVASLYKHIKSGAELLSIESPHSNKSFAVSFDTPPADSTGVEHQIEHIVLNGSQKYPVKDPFTELSKSSLNTFLNAYTDITYTAYPVASENTADFYNLVNVYLDAVFFPLLRRESFEIEGWRYKLEPGAGLSVTGVVLKEMKGDSTSPESVLCQRILEGLFPDTVMRHNSGGKPEEIVTLTYEAFKKRHAELYTAPNARLIFIGDDPEEERLKIADEVLSRAPIGRSMRDPATQPPFSGPRRTEHLYSLSGGEDPEGQDVVSLSWALPADISLQKSFEFEILSRILISDDNDGSLLYRALRESGLGKDVIGGHAANLPQELFFAVLKGASAEDADRIEQIVMSSLEDLVRNGIDSGIAEAAMVAYEYDAKLGVLAGDSGMNLILSTIIPFWHAGKDPIAACDALTPLVTLREKLAAGEKVFENLTEELLISNSHRLRTVLKADPDLAARRKEEERARLAAVESGLSEEERNALITRDQELARYREAADSEEDIAAIPRLPLSEISPHQRLDQADVRKEGDTICLRHPAATGDLLSARAVFNLSALPPDLMPLLPVFCDALVGMGTSAESYADFSARIRRGTGGLSYKPVVTRASGSDDISLSLMAEGIVSAADSDKLTALIALSMRDAGLDNRELFINLAQEKLMSLEWDLEPNGNNFAIRRAHALCDPAGGMLEQMQGVEQIFYLRRLIGEAENNWESVREKLVRIREELTARRPAVISVCGQENIIPFMESSILELFAGLPESRGDTVQKSGHFPAPRPGREALIIPSEVNYIAAVTDPAGMGYNMHGSSRAAVTLLNNEWLWNEIRVKGNAYGAACSLSETDGKMFFSSYRDPNLEDTLTAFRKAGRFLQTTAITEGSLSGIIIGSVGQLDPPRSPFDRAYSALENFLMNIPSGRAQQTRSELLGTTAENIREFGHYLEQASSGQHIAVLGSGEAIGLSLKRDTGSFQHVVTVYE